MSILPKKKIVLLGMMSRMPVAGNAWLVLQYLVGFQRLGYDVYYVEAHGCTPRDLIHMEKGDACEVAPAYIHKILSRFDLGDHWAYHAVHAGNRYFGMSRSQVHELYRSAALIINLHGGTEPLPEHSATGRLIYLGTDPCEVEFEIYNNLQSTLDFLAPHVAFFTWGLNYGNPDCILPWSDRFRFRPSPPPIILDFWQPHRGGPADTFTTIGNWRQPHREVRFQGETYTWSKHFEYLKFLDVPRRTGARFELALSSYTSEDKHLLENKGWHIRHALDFSADLDPYRKYIGCSRGEFTVAKDQNVRLKSGWFSERSAQYLAAGRPVITQETGFSNVLPTGTGLFGFRAMDEIVAAVERVNADYEGQCRGATEVAHEYFGYEVVLKHLLAESGC